MASRSTAAWRLIFVTGLSAFAFLRAPVPAEAASEEEFFRGKQVKIIISGSPGDAYDIYSRVFASHIGKHLPGNPTIVPQNMPGAAGVTSASYVFNVAPKDGTVVGIATTGIPTGPLLSDTPLQFDPMKFGWIGSVTKDPFVGYVWHTSPVQTLAEMKVKEVVMGGLVSGGSASTEYPLMAKELFDFKIRLISGYASTPEIKLATERGEINGSFANSWGSFKLGSGDWIETKKVRVFAQFGFQKHPDLPDVPLFIQEARTDTQRQILKVMLGRQEYAKSFYLPPDTPAVRLETWRHAFDATMKDPDYLAAMKEAKLDVIGTMNGQELTALISDINQTPPEVVQQIKRILAPLRSK
jgi:tripartite-type tricarboxylate transporter receptor subunit TctC